MIDLELAGIAPHAAALVGQQIGFFEAHYEVVANEMMAPRGKSVFLGMKGQACRFCGRNRPTVKFKKKAHAIPEFAGNGTLLTHYECDDCNDRFSAFEDDFGKMTLLERIAGQVGGKGGIPSVKTLRKLSRIDVNAGAFRSKNIREMRSSHSTRPPSS
jgi:HNH endonuclease